MGGSKPGDEIAATDSPSFLQRFEDRVNGAETSRDRFDRRHLTHHHAVSSQQLMRQRVAAFRLRRGADRDQRPASLGGGWGQPARAEATARSDPRPVLRGTSECPQTVERVVGQQALPDQIPDRIDDIVGESADAALDRREERRSVTREVVEDARFERGRLAFCGRLGPHAEWTVKQRQMVGEVKSDPPVTLPQWLHAGPDDLSCRAQRVEVGGAIVLDARRENLGLQDGGGQSNPLDGLDDFEKSLQPPALARDSLP